MKQPDAFEQTLATWFGEDAHVDPPEDLLQMVVAKTRSRRQNPAWLAMLGGDAPTALPASSATRQLILVAGIGVLLLAILGGALLAAGSPSRHLSVAPSVAPESPSPSLSIVDLPFGQSPRLTPPQVAQEVIGMIDANHVGLASDPVIVTKITLLPSGAAYTFGTDAGPMSRYSFTENSLSWVVEATGTYVTCSSFCDTRTSGAYVIDDATGVGRSGGTTSYQGSSVPSESFRGLLAFNGLQYQPMAVPATGVVASSAVIKRLDPRHFASGVSVNSPMFGMVVWQDPALERDQSAVFPGPGASKAIWWVGGPPNSGDIWAAFDASTGDLLDTNVP